MKFFFIFFATCFISFAGSLQLGPVNLAVIRATIQHNLRTGLWLACGGCLPEVLYGFLALHGVMFFEEYPITFQVLQWGIIPVLWIAGISLLLKKTTTLQQNSPQKSHKVSFIQGFTLALLNPQLIAFWTIILLNFQNYEFLKINNVTHQIAFLLGTSVGAFGILFLFAHLANRYRERVFQRLQGNRFNRAIGGVLILIGIIQLVKILA
jgi:threonine/homoserine/homoserine lactone efflux protein